MPPRDAAPTYWGARCRTADLEQWFRRARRNRAPSPTVSPLVVLDTNVVLDAWWFGDPSAAALCSAIETGCVRWMASRAMRDELSDVLGRPAFTQDPVAGRAVLAAFDAWAWMREPAAAPDAPRCTDPDDQAFVDLAVTVGARWLVSRDRALLALRAPLRCRGVAVIAPSDWDAATRAP